jgi:3-phosphoshikimate 1-carboxyvinyltransferase
MDLDIAPVNKLAGEIEAPADKSISHRAVMLGALSDGETIVENFLASEDCLHTIECFRAMGIEIKQKDENEKTFLVINGKGLHGLTSTKDILYVGNSGTAIRLMLGILAGSNFASTITGDESIKKRPMLRVVDPLRKMGATIHGRENGNFAPIEIKGEALHSIEYNMPVASAQVKSALMFAALFAEGTTKITEPALSRDHTEKMFEHFGIPFAKGNNVLSVPKCNKILPTTVNIPGDISSASFFIVAGAIIPNSNILIRNIGLNPTRTGIIDVMHRMGADMEIQNETLLSGELRGDILVKSSKLKGIDLSGSIIPRIIDEIPIIAVAACVAQGQTTISDAGELRVKESDRIKTMAEELRKLGAIIEEKEDGMVIQGGTSFKGAICDSHNDHRCAMSLAIAGLAAKDDVLIENTECIATSFPGFISLLKKLF